MEVQDYINLFERTVKEQYDKDVKAVSNKLMKLINHYFYLKFDNESCEKDHIHFRDFKKKDVNENDYAITRSLISSILELHSIVNK